MPVGSASPVVLPETFSAFPILYRYVCSNVVLFVLVRCFVNAADEYHPGALRSQLWSTVAYRSYFVKFYTTTFYKNMLRFAVVEPLAAVSGAALCALLFGAKKVRLAAARGRQCELETWKTLFSVWGSVAIPESILQASCSAGEDVAFEDVRVERRSMSIQEIVEQHLMTSMLTCAREGILSFITGDSVCGPHEGFSPRHPRCWLGLGLRVVDKLVLPCVSLAAGAMLGDKVRDAEIFRDHANEGSGIRYDVAHAVLFMSQNLWMMFRLFWLPKILWRHYPHITEQIDRVTMPVEVDTMDKLSRLLFEGKTREQLVLVRAQLMRTLADPSSPQLVSPQPTKILECLDRYERKQKGILDCIRANSRPVSIKSLPDGVDQCCICLSGFSEEVPIRQLSCQHCFCAVCIEQWLMKEDTCPLCKNQVLKSKPFIQIALVNVLHLAQCFFSVSLPTYDTDYFEVYIGQMWKGMVSAWR